MTQTKTRQEWLLASVALRDAYTWHNEGYTPTLVKFELPKLVKKRLPVLTADELRQIVKECNVRDKAIVLFMADSGPRRAEVCALNWAAVDMQSGLIRVKQGKGKKDRSAVIGATTRRAPLAYRRTSCKFADGNAPLFQTRTSARFTGSGLRCVWIQSDSYNVIVAFSVL